jgi:carboxypeptidase Taq
MSVAVEAPPQLERLREILGVVADLRHAESVAAWDSRVFMPVRGAPARADVSATLGRLSHERFVSDKVGELLEELRPYEEALDFDSDEASLIRVTRRDWERNSRVPPELVGEMWRSSGLGVAAWDDAKAASDYSVFAPHLERQLELRHRYIECFPPAAEKYDVLLEDYEPGMTAAQVAAIFDEVKEATVPLIDAAPEVDDSFLTGDFDVAAQEEASRRILAAFGYSDEGWRLDVTPHPFQSNPGVGDVRLTTHYRPDDIHSLFSTMHEFGHGVYEWGVDAALARTPLESGTSSALHESQSRTWENLVGRSRAFWRFFYPTLRELFPRRLGDVGEEAFYRGVNGVKRSVIRIDSDEVTYNLHIILRFELERDLLEGRLTVADLPEAWNAAMREYLDVDPEDDAHGVLQDMHWGAGLVGYFPTYSLGNLLSVQIWERVRADVADLDEQIERGEFTQLREWLREHVYRHGRKFTPEELIRKVTDGPIDAGPYVRYLEEKLSTL